PPSSASPAASGAGTALARVTLHGELDAAEVSLLGLKMKDMRAAVDLTNGRAHVGDLAVSLYGGSITGEASADLAAPGPPFDIKAKLQGVDFDSMAKDFSPDMAGLLFGSLDAGLDLRGTGTTRQDLRQAMEGNATFSLQNGKITSVGLLKNLAKALETAGGKGVGEEQTPFSFLGGSFDIRGGKARTQDLRLESTDLTMKGEGKLDMDLGVDLDLDSRLSPEASAAMVAQRENLRFLEDNKERIRLDLHMGGTLIKPVVTVDPETIRRVLKNAAKERLKEGGLRDLFRKKKDGR
ncbi:MAG TPA: AsmA-like C-terminal region-containing protein, partial [Candidatus Saccharimonadales bacterium]|nr:AsmA-like C-terminal region-containing protein [Candidatus Saccharimonadales bacterium]